MQPRTGGGKRAGDKRAGKRRHTPSSGTRTCTHCGREPHPREKCPARDAICHCCNKKGHWGAVCRSKTVAASVEAKPTAGASPIDVAFLDNVTAVDDIAPLRSHTAWFANIQLCGCEIASFPGSLPLRIFMRFQRMTFEPAGHCEFSMA